MDQKWCQNCPKIEWTIFFVKGWFCKKYAFTRVKTYFLRFGGSENQRKSSKHRCKIGARKSGPKMVPKWPEIDPNLSQNQPRKRWKIDSKTRSKNDREKIRKIGEASDQKSKKIGKLRPEGRPGPILGAGLAEFAGPAEALELARSWIPVLHAWGAADFIACAHSAGPGFFCL